MPYAPGIQYRGDEYYFRGISQLGDGIASTLEQYRDRGRKKKALEATIKAYTRGNEALQKEVDAALPGTTLEDLEGLTRGIVMRQAQAQEDQKTELLKAQVEQYREQARQQKAISDYMSGGATSPRQITSVDTVQRPVMGEVDVPTEETRTVPAASPQELAAANFYIQKAKAAGVDLGLEAQKLQAQIGSLNTSTNPVRPELPVGLGMYGTAFKENDMESATRAHRANEQKKKLVPQANELSSAAKTISNIPSPTVGEKTIKVPGTRKETRQIGVAEESVEFTRAESPEEVARRVASDLVGKGLDPQRAETVGRFVMWGMENEVKPLTMNGQPVEGFVITQNGQVIQTGTRAGKMTEQQSKAFQYLSEMQSTTKDIEQLEAQGYDYTNKVWDRFAPDFAKTDKGKQYTAAMDKWIEATLRDRSGAVVPPPEYESSRRQFFPVYGESQEGISRKRERRAAAMRAMAARAAGDLSSMPFGSDGEPIAAFVYTTKDLVKPGK